MNSKDNSLGIFDDEIKKINLVFKKYPQIDKVLIYGSRAMGKHRPGSDIDLTLIGSHLDLNILNIIQNDLDELNYPYTFDLSIYQLISNLDLIDHIQRKGLIFYQK